MSKFHLRLDRKRWAAVRRRILDRDNWRCQICGNYGNEVDHMVALFDGGAKYDLENLRCLCRSCHIEVTADLNRRRNPERSAWRTLVKELL